MRKLAAGMLMVALVCGTAFADDDVEERSPVWLPMFVSSTTIALLGVSVYLYAGHEIDEAQPGIRTELSMTSGSISDSDCPNEAYRSQSKSFDSACTWVSRSKLAIPTVFVMAPIAIISGYLAFREQPKKEKRSVALIPTMTTQSAGAMLDVRW